MRVGSIESVDFNTIRQILTSQKISEAEKTQFIKENKTQIHQLINLHITGHEYRGLMKNRPLKKFRPLKNSFTKRGDKKLLAQALEIDEGDVNEYIENVSSALDKTDNLNFLPPDKINMVKTYVYRHGSKDQLVNFLDYELKSAKDKIKVLYKTLEYHTGGVADYFIRPIHRMDRNTFIKLYNVIDKHIHQAEKDGSITEEDNMKVAKDALVKLYYIKHNNQFINAIKTYKTLSQT